MLEKNTLKCWYHPGFQVFGPCFFSYAGVSPWIFGWAMHLFSISNTPLRIASARCIYAATLLFWSKGHGLLHKGQTYDCSDYRYRMNMYEININIKMKICNPYVCVCIYIYIESPKAHTEPCYLLLKPAQHPFVGHHIGCTEGLVNRLVGSWGSFLGLEMEVKGTNKTTP